MTKHQDPSAKGANSLVNSLNQIFDGIESAKESEAVRNKPALINVLEELREKLQVVLRDTLAHESTSPGDAAANSPLNVALGLDVIFHNQANETGSPHNRLQQFFDESYDDEANGDSGRSRSQREPNWRDENAVDNAHRTIEDNR